MIKINLFLATTSTDRVSPKIIFKINKLKVGAAHQSGAKIKVNHRREYEEVRFFLSYSTEKFRRGHPLMFLKVSGIENLYIRGWEITIFERILYSEKFGCFWKFVVLNICQAWTFRWTLEHRVGGGEEVSRKRCRKLFVSQKKFVRGHLWCFRKFLVWKKFIHKERTGITNSGRKKIVEGTFWCLWVLAYACYWCTCML